MTWPMRDQYLLTRPILSVHGTCRETEICNVIVHIKIICNLERAVVLNGVWETKKSRHQRFKKPKTAYKWVKLLIYLWIAKEWHLRVTVELFGRFSLFVNNYRWPGFKTWHFGRYWYRKNCPYPQIASLLLNSYHLFNSCWCTAWGPGYVNVSRSVRETAKVVRWNGWWRVSEYTVCYSGGTVHWENRTPNTQWQST